MTITAVAKPFLCLRPPPHPTPHPTPILYLSQSLSVSFYPPPPLFFFSRSLSLFRPRFFFQRSVLIVFIKPFSIKTYGEITYLFVCLFGLITSSSTTRLYRGRVPRLTSSNFTCCHTRDRAGRP